MFSVLHDEKVYQAHERTESEPEIAFLLLL